jgi:hypothetical protein
MSKGKSKTKKEYDAVLEAGRHLVSEPFLEFAPLTRVRVLRCIVYEGPYEVVKAILARSQALGEHFHGTRGDQSGYTIYQDKYEIVQEQEVEQE